MITTDKIRCYKMGRLYFPRVKTLRYKMGRLYEAMGVKCNFECGNATCSAVGTIHIVARDFNPWKYRLS